MASSTSDTAPQTLLNLPQEIKDQIWDLLVFKPQNTVTLLTNQDCRLSPISARQPHLSFVNHQLRDEVLPVFYSTNLFLAELSDRSDLAIAKAWLSAIGDENVKCLKMLALCGWVRVPFGHMVSKRWVKLTLDFKNGTMGVESRDTSQVVYNDQHPHVRKVMDELKASLKALVDAREGERFDVQSVGALMDGFHGLCTVY